MLLRKAVVQILRYGVLPQGAQRHVFVAGVQRSGTNMVMDVLERSPETVVYHERDDRAFVNYQMRDRAVIHRLAAQCRAPCFIIKALCESQELTHLMDEFTPALALWVYRDYRDVVNSMVASFPNHARQIRRIVEDPNSAGWRGRGMSSETHELVCRLFHDDMHDPNAAAIMWYLRNVLFFEQELQRNPRVLLVRYESLVTAPQVEIPRIYDFLHLDYSPRLASGVFASSIGKNTPPFIEPAVQAACDDLTERFHGAMGDG